jgi:hypothetical protein
MENKIIEEIEKTADAKEKNKRCAGIIDEFLSMLSIDQKEKFWQVANNVVDYNLYIQDEIFKRLL